MKLNSKSQIHFWFTASRSSVHQNIQNLGVLFQRKLHKVSHLKAPIVVRRYLLGKDVVSLLNDKNLFEKDTFLYECSLMWHFSAFLAVFKNFSKSLTWVVKNAQNSVHVSRSWMTPLVKFSNSFFFYLVRSGEWWRWFEWSRLWNICRKQ